MKTLADYYRQLQEWEGVSPICLISTWPEEFALSVQEDFRSVINGVGLVGMKCPVRSGSTNQSLGNQIQDFVVPLLATELALFTLQRSPGAGYPDCELIHLASGQLVSAEVKATSDWNPNDSSRRVLTSSSEKLRKRFSEPILHLLISIVYSPADGAQIQSLRLDFLEPITPVGVRLEASVSHKILCEGTHRSIVF